MNYQKLKVIGEKNVSILRQSAEGLAVHRSRGKLLRILKSKPEKVNNSKFSFQQHQRLIISQESSFRVIRFEEIRYLKSDSNYTTIHLIDGNSIYVSRTMKSIADQLDESFLRVHNSYVINLLQIRTYHKGDNCITLEGQKIIPISRKRKADIIKLFQ